MRTSFGARQQTESDKNREGQYATRRDPIDALPISEIRDVQVKSAARLMRIIQFQRNLGGNERNRRTDHSHGTGEEHYQEYVDD